MPTDGRQLLWADEFTGAAGAAPDSTVWGFNTGGGGWGNSELQTYTSARANSRLTGTGELELVAVKDGSGNYTSARLLTNGKRATNPAGGRLEVRVRVPVPGSGLWPAVWLLNEGYDGPTYAEIDCMEWVSSDPSRAYGSLHGRGPGGTPVMDTVEEVHTPSWDWLSDTWHTFAVDWDSSAATFEMDGQVYEQQLAADHPAGSWTFAQPLFLVVNLAVGGSWPGAPASDAPFPRSLLVDYVRVYGPRSSLVNSFVKPYPAWRNDTEGAPTTPITKQVLEAYDRALGLAVLKRPYIPTGVVGDGSTNNTTALNNAFAAAERDDVLVLPDGVVNHAGVLTVPTSAAGATLTGPRSILRATAQSTAALNIRADDFTVEDLHHEVVGATSRSGDDFNCCPLVVGIGGSAVVKNFTGRRVTSKGSRSAAFFYFNVDGATLEDMTARDNWADGHHFTWVCKNIRASWLRGYNVGDDVVGIVSYDDNPGQCENIVVRGVQAHGTSAGRGISAVGAKNIRYENVDIRDTYAGGIYIGNENGGTAISTSKATSDITVEGFRIAKANTPSGSPDNGSILVLTTSLAPLTNVRIAHGEIWDPQATRAVIAAKKHGAGTTQGGSNIVFDDIDVYGSYTDQAWWAMTDAAAFPSGVTMTGVRRRGRMSGTLDA